ncbi:YcaO-like family protein [Streptomyces sp. NBC_00289]|uniref:YcaO-like family protein n=1 Tax=Streptomyces sp. NBC_00289 TaxID=2975703 RepID=UPI003255A62A
MTSSLRTAPLAETLSRAKVAAKELGIVRVTDTTWLDCIGIPVFASIRPDSKSLCVNAGKGAYPEEARVGAYMEAIEFALAEYRNREIEIIMSTPREVASQQWADFEFVDLCPVMGVPVDPDGALACVEAEDVTTGRTLLVPAELAYHPFPENPGQRIFGSGTNGLCSGNSIDEATVHGLCEVIERDIRSLNYFKNTSRRVNFGDPTAHIEVLRSKIVSAGLEAVIRYTPNEFELPYFDAFLLESSDDAPVALAYGAGLHLVKNIAAVRALSEAAQSRLTHIHGGRDDLVDRHEYFARYGREFEKQAMSAAREQAIDSAECIQYSAIPDASNAAIDIDSALGTLIETLGRRGIRQVLRVVLSQRFAPLSAVKVVVPKLEHFQPELKRVGPRLATLVNS